MLLLRNKYQQLNNRSKVSQPASAGKGADMSELQAHHCMQGRSQGGNESNFLPDEYKTFSNFYIYI